MAVTTRHNDFSVGFSRDDGTVVVHVHGELDALTAPAVRQALSTVIDEHGSLSVRIDLSGMTFIDSMGLSVLLDPLNKLRKKGGDLTLANPQPTARRIFEIVGFTKIFQIVPPAAGADA